MPLASIPSPSQGVWYLGVIPIRAYALCIVLGVIVAVAIGERRWRARGGTPGTIVDLAVWAVPFGLVGGRLYHVITDWQLYFGPDAIHTPIEALYVWNGGLGIWGAVALGALGVWFGCRSRGISISAVADVAAPAIAVGQAIGRLGNYFNQELFGSPTNLPWALEIDPDKPGTLPGISTYHPAFLYELLWDLGLALVLVWAGRKFALRHGRVFMLYVAGYTLGRFWIEGLRIDSAHHILGLRLNQWTSVVLFVAALVWFWLSRNKTGEERVVTEPQDGHPADPAHEADQADDHETVSQGSQADAGEAEGQDGETALVSTFAQTGGEADPAHAADQADEAETAAGRSAVKSERGTTGEGGTA
ncbi:prolipoprotein diacylglyceryl transferase [Streptosporangium saharense]|uniref:Phosphatidylglycerol--prolipoprotein diacylglyceryl transferase n=1 Tax=Streptosporangium saharense TaxID=1706840 RepID=A0A7W7VMM3_9ACTN|nr:prolipoprotein diacylglyceryl transferase [Streptosporangium saharense]MBB4915778.1 prolipoprotein diacylglyceryl transferase [Streptosporangium saharense]